MRRTGMWGLVRLSLARTELVLFKPFSAGKWARLLLAALFAGALTYGGWSGGVPGGKKEAAAADAAAAAPGPGAGLWADAKPALGALWERTAPRKALLGAALAVSALLLLFLLWVNARFEFVWLHAVMNNSSEIAGPFDDYARPGNSLFLFNLGFLGFWILLAFSAAGGALWAFLRGGGAIVPALGGAAALAAGAFFFSVFVYHFVTAFMAADQSAFWPAFRKALVLLRAHKGDFLLYGLVWLGLRVAAGALATALLLVLALAALLSGALLFGALYAVFFKMMGLKMFFIIVMAALGVPFVFLFVLAAFAAQLPLALFFRALPLYFLSSLEGGRDILPLPGDNGEEAS